MNKLIFLVVTALIASVAGQYTKPAMKAQLLPLQALNSFWLNFKSEYGRVFRNNSVETKRLGVFRTNLQKINDHNEKYNNGNASFQMGITNFADWTEEEFMRYVNRGLLIRPRVKSSRNYTKPVYSRKNRQSLPESVDWRTEGYVNPVRDQGQCGSCWTFSAVSSLESHYFKTNEELLSFSEQHLVDCVYLSQGQTGNNADGCQGGWMSEAFTYIKKNKGVSSLSSYPYSSASSGKWSGRCRASNQNLVGEITDFVEVTSGEGDEAEVAKALANIGPLAAAVYVSKDFQHYTGGVFTDKTCPAGKLNHAVNLVGYGSSNGQDYYIMRNSWGTSWGIDGYMLFRRNNDNQCGIASYTSYPIVKPVNNRPTTPNPTTNQPTTTRTQPQPTTTRSQPQPTTRQTTVIPTTKSQNVPCSNGSGWYSNPGCKTAYYCQQTITTYQCPNGYLFDASSGTCRLTNMVNCQV